MNCFIHFHLHLFSIFQTRKTRGQRSPLSRKAHQSEIETGSAIAVATDTVVVSGADRPLDCANRVVEKPLNKAGKFKAGWPSADIAFGHEERDCQTDIYVRNGGDAFSRAYVDQIFGAFQQFHNRMEFSGGSLGLATAQYVAQRHGR